MATWLGPIPHVWNIGSKLDCDCQFVFVGHHQPKQFRWCLAHPYEPRRS